MKCCISALFYGVTKMSISLRRLLWQSVGKRKEAHKGVIFLDTFISCSKEKYFLNKIIHLWCHMKRGIRALFYGVTQMSILLRRLLWQTVGNCKEAHKRVFLLDKFISHSQEKYFLNKIIHLWYHMKRGISTLFYRVIQMSISLRRLLWQSVGNRKEAHKRVIFLDTFISHL